MAGLVECGEAARHEVVGGGRFLQAEGGAEGQAAPEELDADHEDCVLEAAGVATDHFCDDYGFDMVPTGGIASELEHDRGILLHDPQTLCAAQKGKDRFGLEFNLIGTRVQIGLSYRSNAGSGQGL